MRLNDQFGWMLPIGVLYGFILALALAAAVNEMDIDEGVGSLLAGILAVFAGSLAYLGAKDQAKSQMDGAVLQSSTQLRIERERGEELKRGIAVSVGAIAVEIGKLMDARRNAVLSYKASDSITPEEDVEAYRDAIRSMIVTTHKLLVADLQTISLLGEEVAEATVALYSLTNRYDRFIDECLAFSGIPVRYLEYYDDLATCALNCVSGAQRLTAAIKKWQLTNAPSTVHINISVKDTV